MRKHWGRGTAILWGVAVLMSLEGGARAQAAKKKAPPARGNAVSAPKPSAQPATVAPDYLIGPDDMLDITVFNEPNHSRAVPVRSDGKISLPLLNDVQAAGLTPMQLGASITDRLKKYVADPQVTVIVTAINSKRVYVLGEVAHPGPQNLLYDMTVLQALANAGGFSQFAKEKAIYLLRNENGKQQRYPFNYRLALRGVGGQDFPLKPGDTIVVP